MSRLVVWKTPFAEAFFPSVIATFERRLDGTSLLTVTVMPVDSPHYVLACDEPLAFSCLDESCAPQKDFGDTEVEDAKACSWQWLDSPWIKSYQDCNYDAGGPVPLNHYMIFGGDNIVEFVCRHEVTIAEAKPME